MRFAIVAVTLRVASVFIVALAASVSVGQTLPAAAELLPEDTLAVMTLHNGAGLVSEFRDSRWLKQFLGTEGWRSLSQEEGVLKAQGGLYFVAGACRMEPWQLVGQGLGRELTVALIPGRGGSEPSLVVVIKPDQAEAARRLLDQVLTLSGAVRGGEPVEGRSHVVDGIRGYQLNPGAYVVSFDDLIVFCNDGDVLEKIVTARASNEKKLAGTEAVKQAAGLHPKEAVATGYVNVKLIRGLRSEPFTSKLDNAIGAMVFGGLQQAAREADAAALWITADEGQVCAAARLIGGQAPEPTLRLFAAQPRETRDWAALRIPGLLSGIHVSRDWSGLWDERERLLNADGLRDLLSFASTLTTLMGGMDFSSELLPELEPTLHLLAARQVFEKDAPAPQLPGFALLMQLKDAAKLGPRLENAALMTLSIINVDAGQKMRPQYQMQVDQYRNTRLMTARFPESAGPGPRDIRYNFEPSMAAVGDRFVIATSRRLLEQLIDAEGNLPKIDLAPRDSAKPPAPARRSGDVFWIDASELVRVLEANRELLVTQRMLEEDLERNRAAGQVGILLDALKTLDRIEVNMDLHAGTIAARVGLAGAH
jgi:hypothetical protein